MRYKLQTDKPVPPMRSDSKTRYQHLHNRVKPHIATNYPSGRVCTPDISGKEEINRDGVSVRVTRVRTPTAPERRKYNRGRFLLNNNDFF